MRCIEPGHVARIPIHASRGPGRRAWVVDRSMHHHTPDALEIAVGSVTTRPESHSLLAESLRFPAYYSKNWDAFDECLRDVALPSHVEITGLESLRVRLPRETCFSVALRNCNVPQTSSAEAADGPLTSPASPHQSSRNETTTARFRVIYLRHSIANCACMAFTA